MDLLPDPASEAQAFLSAVRDKLGDTLHRSTLPILSQRDAGRSGPTVLAGSAVLIGVDDARFLVSAAHVLRLKPDIGAVLCVPTGVGVTEDVGGDLVTAEDHERVDVGVLRLSDIVSRKIEALGAVFLRMATAQSLDPKALPDGGYVVYGYPGAGSHTDATGALRPVPHYLGCVPYRRSVDLLDKYDPEVHALLDFKRHELVNQATGQIDSFPEPQGMSGCGVWWAYAPNDVRGGWRPEDARLVAIQSAWYRDPGVLVTVPMQYVRSMIVKAWPELSGPLAIVAPRRRR